MLYPEVGVWRFSAAQSFSPCVFQAVVLKVLVVCLVNQSGNCHL